MNDALGAALMTVDKLTRHIAEARAYLNLGEGEGQACPVCRGVVGHADGCYIALALITLCTALNEEAQA